MVTTSDATLLDAAATTIAGLRESTDADADGLAKLIGDVYAEYPGCVLDLQGVDADLTAIRTALAPSGGRMWVVERDDRIVACIGYAPTTVADRRAIELKRLYVARVHRRQGLGSALVRLVEQVAAMLDAPVIELWSDTRFDDAHRLYEALGWVRYPDTRDLNDPSDSTEYHYVRLLPRGAQPDHRITWRADDERVERAGLWVGDQLVRMAGTVLTTDPARRWDYEVVCDGAWRTRYARLDGDGRRVVTIACDGDGAWWVDGQRRGGLDGCVDVDLGLSPITNTLPIRRGADGTLRMAWLRFPELDVVPADQTYIRFGHDRWRYASDGFEADLQVDRHGLVRRYGDNIWVAT